MLILIFIVGFLLGLACIIEGASYEPYRYIHETPERANFFLGIGTTLVLITTSYLGWQLFKVLVRLAA